jgi:hypothetical protein
MNPNGSRALPRLFRKLVVGIALTSSPPAIAARATVLEDDESMSEVDRAIGVVLESMVERAIAHRKDVAEVLGILLQNMHPLDATRSICEAAMSPSADVRRVLCETLSREEHLVGRQSVLHHLMTDADPNVRHAAVRAARS